MENIPVTYRMMLAALTRSALRFNPHLLARSHALEGLRDCQSDMASSLPRFYGASTGRAVAGGGSQDVDKC